MLHSLNNISNLSRTEKSNVVTLRSFIHGFGMPLLSKYFKVADAKVFPQITVQYCYEILSFY